MRVPSSGNGVIQTRKTFPRSHESLKIDDYIVYMKGLTDFFIEIILLILVAPLWSYT